jgi:hypothetical protein
MPDDPETIALRATVIDGNGYPFGNLVLNAIPRQMLAAGIRRQIFAASRKFGSTKKAIFLIVCLRR